MNDHTPVLPELMGLIEDRKANLPEDSYTTALFQGGVDAIGAKITEESAEVVDAASEAGEDGRRHLVREAADLVFHLLVMLGLKGIRLTEVEDELARRFGVSGLQEKASRDDK